MNRMIKAQVALEEKRRELGKLLDLEERAEDYDGKVAAAKAAIEAAQNELAAAALLEPETPEKREQTSEGRRSGSSYPSPAWTPSSRKRWVPPSRVPKPS